MAIQLTLLEQVIATGSGFVLKPAYMIAMFVMVLYLRKVRDIDLKQLRAGVAVFLLGEVFCAIDYLFASGTSIPMQWLHGFGMVVGTAMICLGFVTMLDERVLFFSDQSRPCAVGRFCRNCKKMEGGRCPFEWLFVFAALSLAVMCLMPLCSPLATTEQTAMVFGTPVCQSSPAELLFFEMRVYPIAALLLFVVSAVVILVRKHEPVRAAKYTFSLATGFFIYGLLMYVLQYCYRDNLVWATFWEEVTEFMMTAGLALFLWIFRSQLGVEKRTGTGGPSGC
ncbi:MAG: hypothetical protein WC889_13930 [Myxococcota bacterium]|jgi:hypothetical protein